MCTPDDARIRYREPMKGPYAAQYGAPYLMAHRADLHRLLCELVPAKSVRRAGFAILRGGIGPCIAILIKGPAIQHPRLLRGSRSAAAAQFR